MTHVVVEVVFKDEMGQVAQQEEVPLQVIRTNGAYPEPVDLECFSAGSGADATVPADVRHISAQWNRQYPEIRVTDVTVK